MQGTGGRCNTMARTQRDCKTHTQRGGAAHLRRLFGSLALGSVLGPSLVAAAAAAASTGGFLFTRGSFGALLLSSPSSRSHELGNLDKTRACMGGSARLSEGRNFQGANAIAATTRCVCWHARTVHTQMQTNARSRQFSEQYKQQQQQRRHDTTHRQAKMTLRDVGVVWR